MKDITTFITFDGRAEEAMNYYCSLFEDSEIISVEKYPESSPTAGTVLGAEFKLFGQKFMAMDVPGGFPLGEGMSIFVSCDTQEEVDHLWEGLTDGGEEQPCGWLRDRYGVSWQIIPTALPELIGGSQGKQQEAVINAMLGMKKIDIAALQKAFDERE